MKFSMEQETLITLGKRSSGESEDLGSLVRRLYDAVEPLEGQINGPARAAFDKFKSNVDDISGALNSALNGIVGSISNQNIAFVTAADEGADAHTSAEGSVDFGEVTTLRNIGSHTMA